MALYNGGYPINYPSYFQPQYAQGPVIPPQQMQGQQPVQTPPPQNPGIIWVSGEAGARGYAVAPNTTVQLWDSEAQRIYIKSADASGMPSIKTLEYTILDNTPRQTFVKQETQKEYVNRDEFDILKAEFDTLRAEFEKKSPKREEK